MGHANPAVPQTLRGTSTLIIYVSTYALLFCQILRESCSITLSVDIAPSLHKITESLSYTYLSGKGFSKNAKYAVTIRSSKLNPYHF